MSVSLRSSAGPLPRAECCLTPRLCVCVRARCFRFDVFFQAPRRPRNVLLRVWRSSSRRKRGREERIKRRRERHQPPGAGQTCGPPYPGPRPRYHQCLSIKIIQIACPIIEFPPLPLSLSFYDLFSLEL